MSKKKIVTNEIDMEKDNILKEREIKRLFSQYEMLENTKQQMIERGKEDYIGSILESQEDVIEQVKNIDPSKVEDLLKNNKRVKKDISIKKVSKQKEELIVNDIDSNMAYDVITLPSHGQCYATKVDRLPVGYLTAYDENFITSPNLYRDGLVIDFLLRNKVLNSNIDVDDLCVGDADAITLFLRATSYGIDFPITVRDPETNEMIETTVDLTKLKYKEFNLKGDENGHFEFVLPMSKDVVKFRFLTRNDEKKLKQMSKSEQSNLMAFTIRGCKNTIIDMMDNDTVLNGKEKQDINKLLDNIDNWAEKLDNVGETPYSKLITNRMELTIMAVNDNYDEEYIKQYIKHMSAKDSLMFRRYVMENEPGVDFEIEVQRPESLGGGSFKTFLNWDDSIFLNFT